MLRKLRPRSAYDVMAALALLIAVSTGGAYASHELINSSDVVDESLTGADVKNSSLNGSSEITPSSLGSGRIADNSLAGVDVANGTLTGADIGNDTLTGDDIVESNLGKVPDADKLDNLDSTQLSPVTGDGRTADLTLNGNSQSVLSANITTARSGALLVSAAVNLGRGGGGGARVYCDLLFDGAIRSVEYGTNHDGGAAEETLPVVWAQGVGAGAHTVVLRCRVPVGLSTVLNAGLNVSAHV
jgi:hypothetical protein